MSNISEATPEDWEDFWYCEDTEDDIVVNMDGGVGGSWHTNWGSPILGAPADY